MEPIQRGGLRQIDVFSQWTRKGRRLEQNMTKIFMAEQLKSIDIWEKTKLLTQGGKSYSITSRFVQQPLAVAEHLIDAISTPSITHLLSAFLKSCLCAPSFVQRQTFEGSGSKLICIYSPRAPVYQGTQRLIPSTKSQVRRLSARNKRRQ